MARPGFVRSLNFELIEGATDGAAKKSRPNWREQDPSATLASRAGLFQGENGYGMGDAGARAMRILKGVVRGI